MAIPLDPRFIPAFSIEDVLLDKDTGQPLSGGLVYFEQDNQGGTLKPVYQISGTSPNYTFVELPNPMTLSSIGTFEDALSNPVVPYFFPYDDNGNVEYYYVRVTSSSDVPQFVRKAVPYIGSQENTEVLSVITNELSNPQFIEVTFDTSSSTYTYNFTAASEQVVNIAPNWDLIVTAPTTGTVTVGQVKPAGSLNIATNPGTILTVQSASVTALKLRQRIYGSPNLWGSGYLSGTFVAKTFNGSPVVLNMYYSQSNGAVVDKNIVSATLSASGAYEQFSSSLLIPASNSTQAFPNAYVDIYFDIPLGIKIGLTSVMTAFTGDASIDNIDYDQESLDRQIDHLYHNAYPIVPVGTVIDFGGFAIPDHYLVCDGTDYDRIEKNLLFQAITTVETVTLTLSSADFTVVSADDYWIGMAIEGDGIDPSTTISNISGTTITMSNVATSTGASDVRFFAAGAGDGSTTFNVYDCQGFVIAGANGTVFSAGHTGIGATGGSATTTLSDANMPASVPVAGAAFSTQSVQTGVNTNVPGGAGSWAGGSATAFSNIQPTILMRKCIRFE